MQRLIASVLGTCLFAAAGCSAPPAPPLVSVNQADFVNGDFESGDLSGWSVQSNLNVGLGVVPPTQLAELNLQTGGANKTSVKSGLAPESVLAAGLQAGDTLMYPRFGQYSVVVNELGANRNANHLTQTMTTKAADIDPVDGKIHVRFCLAPVLQNPAHAASQQPYFYLEVRNTTKDKILFSSFNFGGQAGVPWKSSGGGSVQYTDWQLFDVAPDGADLGAGDTVQMEVVASGCSQGGHWGHLYVDAFGTTIPGLTITAAAPQTATPDSNLTYTFQVKNGAAADATSALALFTLPAGTTFASATGATCNTPAVGASGLVSCSLGTVAAGGGTSFQITVHIDAGASGSIQNGDYVIQGAGISPLIGPLVTTALAYPITASAVGGNGSISCPSSAQSGQNVVCTIAPAPGYSLASLSLDGADVQAGVVGNTFTIPNVSAAHSLLATFGVATYAITASVPGGNGLLSCQSPVLAGASSVCTITPDAGFTLSALQVDGTSALGGVSGTSYVLSNVSSGHSVQAAFAPVSYAIMTSVPGGNGTLSCTGPVVYGGSSVCTLLPAAGYGLASLSDNGADVMGAASGGSYTLSSVTAAHSVQATFALALHVIQARVPGGNGSVACTSPVVNGQTAFCQISPAVGYWLDALNLDGRDVLGQVVGNSLQLPGVTSAHVLTGSFSLSSYGISASVPSGNGAVSCTPLVLRGGTATCTLTPATGYALGTLTLDGMDVLMQVAGNSLEISSVTAPHRVQATFNRTTNLIAVSVPSGHGAIGCTAPVLYGQGSMCQILPDEGYRLRALTLDGSSVLAQLQGNSLAIANVTGPRALQGLFEQIPLYSIAVSIAGGHGTISCTGPIPEGQSASCTIAAESGYELDALFLDGVNARILLQGQRLALYDVRAVHSLSGFFKKALARSCASSSECHSGFCSDGVCCNRSCNGQCEACDVGDHVGTCSPVESGAPRSDHPSCGEYLCSAGGCMTSCQSDSQCMDGAVCLAGNCVQGEHTLSGGGIGGCSAAGSSSAAIDMGWVLIALWALLQLRRGAKVP